MVKCHKQVKTWAIDTIFLAGFKISPIYRIDRAISLKVSLNIYPRGRTAVSEVSDKGSLVIYLKGQWLWSSRDVTQGWQVLPCLRKAENVAFYVESPAF